MRAKTTYILSYRDEMLRLPIIIASSGAGLAGLEAQPCSMGLRLNMMCRSTAGLGLGLPPVVRPLTPVCGGCRDSQKSHSEDSCVRVALSIAVNKEKLRVLSRERSHQHLAACFIYIFSKLRKRRRRSDRDLHGFLSAITVPVVPVPSYSRFNLTYRQHEHPVHRLSVRRSALLVSDCPRRLC